MHGELATIIQSLIRAPEGGPGLSGLDIPAQFDPQAAGPEALARSLNAAFLLAMAGDATATNFLDAQAHENEAGDLAGFFKQGLQRVRGEVSQAVAKSPQLAASLEGAAAKLVDPSINRQKALPLVWEVLFPEGLAGLGKRAPAVAELRRRRRIEVASPNPEPIDNPVEQVLFTSNVLLTTPAPDYDPDSLGLDMVAKEQLAAACQARQDFWYDHPIPLGVAPENNEVLYGLRGLAQALDYDQRRHPQWAAGGLTCLLSVSVTHKDLHQVARRYLNGLLGKNHNLEGLNIFLFTEDDTDRLKEETLLPAAEHFLPGVDLGPLKEVMGVDGEYGRHYSFLKAISAWWQALVDAKIKATFKIDLDQVFPQEELLSQSGATALEHLCSPLWGAKGRDAWGREVELGLLAGALVNQADLQMGLFTPDVPWPASDPAFDQWVFFSTLPQALSTEAEMMTRYGDGGLDGGKACLQRVHVTGGTTGALVDSLRRFRPFTPSFIGRAEDQAYLLSALGDSGLCLRYLHQPGLIMRHDKESLTPQAIAAAKTGKIVGDYMRTLYFSQYARDLPWGLDQIKEAIDPFTGCFVSRLPLTVVHLRLALKAAALFAAGSGDAALDLLSQGPARLQGVLQPLEQAPRALGRIYEREKAGWNLFFDLLDHLEKGLARGEPLAAETQKRAQRLARDCRV